MTNYCDDLSLIYFEASEFFFHFCTDEQRENRQQAIVQHQRKMRQQAMVQHQPQLNAFISSVQKRTVIHYNRNNLFTP